MRPSRKTILQEVQELVYGDRQAQYDHPAKDYARTAKIWSGILIEKLLPGVEITPKEAVLMMAGVKISREVHKHHRDNNRDGAGYFECAERIEGGDP